jgi:SAM-dependent methyltransferase
MSSTPLPAHLQSSPSVWVQRWSHLIAPPGPVLDVACGSGRHVRWLAAQGLSVCGVDRDAAAVEPLRALAEIVVADIEGGPWPLADRRFSGIVITNYLWRPLMPVLAGALAPGGVLIHETFACGHESIGRPSNPDFLLRPGELASWALSSGLRVIAFEDGYESAPERFVQRIVAVRERDPAGALPTRWPLTR